MTPIREEISKNLLFYRRRSGLSQKQFAEKLGVRSSTVSSWENGNNSVDIETLFKVCDILNVTIFDMYGKYANSSDDRLTPKDRSLITAYHDHPEVQHAVDLLLGLSDTSGD